MYKAGKTVGRSTLILIWVIADNPRILLTHLLVVLLVVAKEVRRKVVDSLLRRLSWVLAFVELLGSQEIWVHQVFIFVVIDFFGVLVLFFEKWAFFLFQLVLELLQVLLNLYALLFDVAARFWGDQASGVCVGPRLLLRWLMRPFRCLEGWALVLGGRQGWLDVLLGCALLDLQVVLLHLKLRLSENISVCLLLIAFGGPLRIVLVYRRLFLLASLIKFLLHLTIIRNRFSRSRSRLLSRFIPIEFAVLLHHFDLFSLLVQSLFLLPLIIHFLKQVNLIFDKLLFCHIAMKITQLLLQLFIFNLPLFFHVS